MREVALRLDCVLGRKQIYFFHMLLLTPLKFWEPVFKKSSDLLMLSLCYTLLLMFNIIIIIIMSVLMDFVPTWTESPDSNIFRETCKILNLLLYI